jgi:uncharacterized FAD-dependent dehydrogenase
MKEPNHQVIVVGAGPAGLFACYELLKHSVTDVLLIERGRRVADRGGHSDTLFGVGGAGLYSDGKLNFTPKRGKTDLTEFLPLAQAQELVDYLEAAFAEFGMTGKCYPSDPTEAEDLRSRAIKLGMDLLLVKQKHLGSDRLPSYIARMEQYLLDKGVTILTETLVSGVVAINGEGKGVLTEPHGTIYGRYVLLAPGRSGNQWLADQMTSMGGTLAYQPIEVGVRVEVAAEILDGITQVMYDPPIFFFSQSYDDQLRTFCTNPRGFVTQEDYKGFVCVNGHAYKSRHSENSNFALLNKISLSEPITNTIAYGESIAKLANTIGAGRPLLQRYADFRRFRRSTWSRLGKGYVNPTFDAVTPGDIGMALPHRVVVNLLEGLERLDKLVPGIASDSTLLYAPEVKFHSCRPTIDSHLETEIHNVFVAGDGAGASGNIVGAAATGVIAARRIIARSLEE